MLCGREALGQDVTDLGGDRHVEPCHGLVEKDDKRIPRQRPGDRYPLCLTPGQLMRPP